MSQVLQPNEGDSWPGKRAWWWLAGPLVLVAGLVAGGWQLAGGNDDPAQVLGLGAGKSQPPSGPDTEVLGSQANRPELEPPTITSAPTSPSGPDVRFAYSH